VRRLKVEGIQTVVSLKFATKGRSPSSPLFNILLMPVVAGIFIFSPLALTMASGPFVRTRCPIQGGCHGCSHQRSPPPTHLSDNSTTGNGLTLCQRNNQQTVNYFKRLSNFDNQSSCHFPPIVAK